MHFAWRACPFLRKSKNNFLYFGMPLVAAYMRGNYKFLPNFADNKYGYFYPISALILFNAFFSRRETCACEIPTWPEISVCVFPSKYLR